MQEIVTALAEQHAELDALLAPLDDDGWNAAAPACPGWNVADVVLHMAQTDELGTASARGQLAGGVSGVWSGDGATVDDGAATAVEQERGVAPDALLARWRRAACDERDALLACNHADRVQWVSGDLAARTLATTRLAECWIHTNDVAEALGATLTPGDRLRHIARLAHRTLPYAFGRAGESLTGDVAVMLVAPDGSTWEFGDASTAPTVVRGTAIDFCRVAGRRAEPAETGLTATGPDADAVLRLVRTYA